MHPFVCVCGKIPKLPAFMQKEAEATKTVSVSADFNMGNSVKDIFFIV